MQRNQTPNTADFEIFHQINNLKQSYDAIDKQLREQRNTNRRLEEKIGKKQVKLQQIAKKTQLNLELLSQQQADLLVVEMVAQEIESELQACRKLNENSCSEIEALRHQIEQRRRSYVEYSENVYQPAMRFDYGSDQKAKIKHIDHLEAEEIKLIDEIDKAERILAENEAAKSRLSDLQREYEAKSEKRDELRAYLSELELRVENEAHYALSLIEQKKIEKETQEKRKEELEQILSEQESLFTRLGFKI